LDSNAAGVLTLTFYEGVNVPCGESAGCELVAKSPIAAPGGVPIALVGTIAYAVLIVCGIVGLGRSQAAKRFAAGGYLLAAICSLISVGLTLYSVRVIGATCRWCLASTIVFCLTLIAYALCASSDQSTHRGIAIGRLLIVFATLVSMQAVLFTGKTLEYEPPVVDIKVLTVTRHEDLAPDTSPVLGDAKSDYTIVFFGDLQCRACKAALPVLRKEIASTPHTRLVYRYFPLSIHDFAWEAAVAAESAKQTVGFWPFVWKLYSNPDYLDLAYLRETERWAGLGKKVVDGRFVDSVSNKVVDADHALGVRLGLKGTPTIIIIHGKRMTALSYKAALDNIREFRARISSPNTETL